MPSIHPSFSIIIPTFQRHPELCQCLDNLAPYFDSATRSAQDIFIEVIVSDDARDPQLKPLLLKRYPWCRYTEGPARGPAANRNHGAKLATAEWIIFTDDDCVPQPGWIQAYSKSTSQFDVLEGRTSPLGVRTRVDDECPINVTGGYLWSCNFAIRRNTFWQLGGFNEFFPAAAMEDVELNRRINKMFLRRQFLYNAEVKHPWRKRKGRNFLKAHAQSVATYVRLHPETAPSFSQLSLVLNLFRSLKDTLGTCVSTGNFRGLVRQICLNVYAKYATWQALKQL
jgi:GT2 family glycosyltransferase